MTGTPRVFPLPGGWTQLSLNTRALMFAAWMHRDQVRRYGGGEYIWHPIAVATLLQSLNASDTAIVAALLHDVVEDTEASVQDIEELFGAELASLVSELTNPIFQHKRERLEYFRGRIPRLSRAALQVKLADRLVNLLDPTPAPAESLSRWRQETQAIVAAIPDQHAHDSIVKKLVGELGDFLRIPPTPPAHGAQSGNRDET